MARAVKPSGATDRHRRSAIVVAARTAGADSDRDGIGLFVVPADASGLTCQSQTRLDSRGAANISFDGVQVGEDAALGDPGAGLALLERVVDRATVGLCGEMLGGMSAALEIAGAPRVLVFLIAGAVGVGAYIAALYLCARERLKGVLEQALPETLLQRLQIAIPGLARLGSNIDRPRLRP